MKKMKKDVQYQSQILVISLELFFFDHCTLNIISFRSKYFSTLGSKEMLIKKPLGHIGWTDKYAAVSMFVAIVTLQSGHKIILFILCC